VKIHYEITSIADAKRAQVMLDAYIKSIGEPQASVAVRERLTAPAKLATNGHGKRPGWTPERRAKFQATLAKRKRRVTTKRAAA
jgi:hypothetical protein